MSIPVDLAALGAELERYGDTAYLLTVGDHQRPHAVAVTVAPEGPDLVARPAGRRTLGNAAARPSVSLLWPPYEPGGYTLLVDGTGTAEPEGEGAVRVRVTHAVLHRPAPPAEGSAAGTGECGADCVPLVR